MTCPSPYAVVRVGFEPATLRTQGTELNTEPPHPSDMTAKIEPVCNNNVAVRVGFEPATFRTQGTEPTTEPPHPINIYIWFDHSFSGQLHRLPSICSMQSCLAQGEQKPTTHASYENSVDIAFR